MQTQTDKQTTHTPGTTDQSILYSPLHDIRNLSALPSGSGCRYLKTIRSHEPGVLVAKSWHRKPPRCTSGELVIVFGDDVDAALEAGDYPTD